MKKETIKFFNLKKVKHPTFGWGYRYSWRKDDWCKDVIALEYTLHSIELWAKNMQEVLRKEENL